MNKKNKKKNGFLWIVFSFILGCMFCEIIPVVSKYVFSFNSKKSHVRKLKDGYYDT